MKVLSTIARTRNNPKAAVSLPLDLLKILTWRRDRTRTMAVLTAFDIGLPRDILKEYPETRHTFKKARSELGRKSLRDIKNWKTNTKLCSELGLLKVNHDAGLPFVSCLSTYEQAFGFTLAGLVALTKKGPAYTPTEEAGVLYVLSSHPGERQNGYNVRSLAVIDHLQSQALDVKTLSLTRHANSTPDTVSVSDLSGELLADLQYFADAIIMRARAENCGIIVGASNWFTGLASLMASRRLGIPCYYEMRGIWALTRLTTDPEYKTSLGFAVQEHFEKFVAKSADGVFTLNKFMKSWLVERGVSANNIQISSNGSYISNVPVLKDRPRPVPFTVGFIGTITNYEGLSTLIQAVYIAREAGEDIHLKIVGDGPATESAQAEVEHFDLEAICEFSGRVTVAEARSAFNSIDVAVIPRRDTEVTRLVQPLKVIEALSMDTVIITSDLPPLGFDGTAEPVTLTFPPDDARALADLLMMVKANLPLRESLKKSAREHAKNYDWEITLKPLSMTLKASLKVV